MVSRLDVLNPVYGMAMVGTSSFLCYTAQSIKVWQVNSISNSYVHFQSEPRLLVNVPHGQSKHENGGILCFCEDSSIRLFNVASGDIRWATVPDIETVGKILQIQCSLALQRLFVLLDVGDVRVFCVVVVVISCFELLL